MHATAREIPHEPGVHGPERQLAGLRLGARARDIAEQPLELRAGEIGVHHEAGLALDQRRQPAGLQLVAPGGGAAILPHNRVMHRLARVAVPDHGGFPLIGDSDGGDVCGSQSGLAERVGGRVQLSGPDLRRVVLDPARRGKNLTKLFLRRRNDAAAVVEHHGARARRALVQGQDVLHAGHQVLYTSAAIKPPMIGPATGIHA